MEETREEPVMLAVVPRMRPPAEAALAATREGEVYLFYRVRGGRRRKKEEEGVRGRRRRDRGIMEEPVMLACGTQDEATSRGSLGSNEGGRGVVIL
jgi:hypothetical protein